MVSESDLQSGRELILTACLERYEQQSPTAWVIWQGMDPRVIDAVDRAARQLENEGLIEAQFTADRVMVHTRLTEAGIAHAKSRGQVQATAKWQQNRCIAQALDTAGKVLAQISISLDTVAGQDFATTYGREAAADEVEKAAKEIVRHLATLR